MKEGNKKRKSFEGNILISSRGYGYVRLDPTKSADKGDGQDIEIKPQLLHTALNGDTVKIHILAKKNERPQGEVVRVLERKKTEFVGILENKKDFLYLVPDDNKMYVDIKIKNQSTLKDKENILNQKALVKMDPWNDSNKGPEGEVVTLLGEAGVHETEMKSIVLSHGFNTTFSEEVQKEAAEIKNSFAIREVDLKKRRDLRSTTIFTIDPADAKDFDDALSLQTLKNGNFEVGIHIADVSHFVKPGMLVDDEARERATSVYLVDRTIPMLPEELSNDLCSLNPKEDKFAFSALFELSPEGKIIRRWFGKTIINSDKRFSYEEAQGVLDKKEGVFFNELNTLNELSKKLREEKFKEGAIAFEDDEVEFELDKEGKPIKIYRKERGETHLLIEDFMLLANKEVAEFLYNKCKKSARDSVVVFRIHDEPSPEKIEELALFLKAIGYDLKNDRGIVSSKEINRLLKEIKGKPEEGLVKKAAIRSMSKAIYSTKNIGHFGLAFKFYTHFTSPIRRYPDLMVHRLLESHLDNSEIPTGELKKYQSLVVNSSQKEIEAVSAERDSIKYKQVEYMSEHIGEIFDGVITGVIEWGIFVEEKNTKSEGMIRVSDLKDDYYVLENKYRMVGEKRKKRFSLGDSVRIQLVKTNLDDKTIDWKLVS